MVKRESARLERAKLVSISPLACARMPARKRTRRPKRAKSHANAHLSRRHRAAVLEQGLPDFNEVLNASDCHLAFA